jgi:transcriptional regulator of aromatic amino acid metabolism
VEDWFIEANGSRIIPHKTGYAVCTLASSVDEAVKIKNKEKPLRTLEKKEGSRYTEEKRSKFVRIEAATNRNLEKEVAEGSFRSDLY